MMVLIIIVGILGVVVFHSIMTGDFHAFIEWLIESIVKRVNNDGYCHQCYDPEKKSSKPGFAGYGGGGGG